MTASQSAQVPTRSLFPSERAPGSFVQALLAEPDSMAYLLVNVGDGDTQLVVLPQSADDGVRRLLVIDVATQGKLPALIDSLHAAGLVEPFGSRVRSSCSSPRTRILITSVA